MHSEKIEAGQRGGQKRNRLKAEPARKQEPEGTRCQCSGEESRAAPEILAGKNERECQTEHGKNGCRKADSPDVVPANQAEDPCRRIHESWIEAEIRRKIDGKMTADDLQRIERIECLIVLKTRRDAVQPEQQEKPRRAEEDNCEPGVGAHEKIIATYREPDKRRVSNSHISGCQLVLPPQRIQGTKGHNIPDLSLVGLRALCVLVASFGCDPSVSDSQ